MCLFKVTEYFYSMNNVTVPVLQLWRRLDDGEPSEDRGRPTLQECENVCVCVCMCVCLLYSMNLLIKHSDSHYQ